MMGWLTNILGLNIDYVLKMKIINSFIEYLANFHAFVAEIDYDKLGFDDGPLFSETKYDGFVDDHDDEG